MRKVNLTVIRPWIAKKVVELVGFEDEVVVEYAMGLLEDEQQPVREPLLLAAGSLLTTGQKKDPRPQKDANKPHGLFDDLHACLHVCSVAAASRGTGLARWRPTDFC
jgi:hypothetical protein